MNAAEERASTTTPVGAATPMGAVHPAARQSGSGQPRKTKVLYIAGNGRSGSTLLNVVLGQLDGFFAVGELRRVWERGVIENRQCGCGSPFVSCPFWTEVFDMAFGGMDGVDPQTMLALRERMTQTKHLLPMLAGRNRAWSSPNDLDRYLDALGKLYDALQAVSGCDVIVDASKWPMYARMLDQLPNVELYVLHLVRDPRALAFSWARKKQYEPGRYLPQQGPLRATLYWMSWNPAIHHFWDRPGTHYMRLAYEDFVRHPRQSLTDIVRFVGEEERALPLIDDRTLRFDTTHSVAGNKARTTRGPVTLKLDDEWRSKASWRSKAIVSSLSWPLLRRYNYPLQTKRSRD